MSADLQACNNDEYGTDQRQHVPFIHMTKDADCSRRGERNIGFQKLSFNNKGRCRVIFNDEEAKMQIAVKKTNVDLLLIFEALCRKRASL